MHRKRVFSNAGGAGWLFPSEGRIALGCQGRVIDVVGRRLDKEKNMLTRLACKAVTGGVGREEAGLIKDEGSMRARRMRLVDVVSVF
jgi:hypothetical protein